MTPFPDKPRKYGHCYICGERSTHNVQLAARVNGTIREPSQYRASTSLTFCESCAETVYERLAEQLQAFRRVEPTGIGAA